MVFKKLRHQLFRPLKFNLSSPHPSLSPLTPILTSSHPSLPLLPLPLLTPRSLPLTPQLHALAKTPYDSLLFLSSVDGNEKLADLPLLMRGLDLFVIRMIWEKKKQKKNIKTLTSWLQSECRDGVGVGGDYGKF